MVKKDSTLRLCPDCDLVLQIQPFVDDPTHRQQAVCPRCGHCLEAHRPEGVMRCLALVLTGLLLFFPANYFPLLIMDILDNERQSTIFNGVQALYLEGFGVVALLVLLSAIVIPLLRLVVLLQVLLAVTGYSSRMVARRFLRGYHQMAEWGMTEIFFLGALVSIIKLADMAKVHVGVGLYCFVGLMLVELAISLNLNEHALWSNLDEDERGVKHA